jgi:ACS family glucarate transporter-like MFS transporter
LSAVILFTPFVEDIWLLVALFTISLTGMATAISLNFSLVNDLLRNPEDSGKAMAILVVGGNIFGVTAPIATGYVIQATGSYNWAFAIAGLLLVTGATILLTMTRSPIEIAKPRA